MRKILSAAAVLGVAMGAGAAHAADISYVAPTVVAPVVVPGFDWSGPYVGPTVGMYFEPGGGPILLALPPPGALDDLSLGAVAGYNFVRDQLLLGFDFSSYVIFFSGLGGGNSNLQLIGRARIGTFVGEEDRVLLYAAAGVGGYINVNGGGGDQGLYGTFAAGVEIAPTDAMSLRIEGSTYNYPGGCFFGCMDYQVTTGVIFHFGK